MSRSLASEAPAADEPAAPIDEPTRLASCFQLLGRVEDQVRFADSKAGFLASVQALLVGPLVYNVPEVRRILPGTTPPEWVMLCGLGAVYGVLFLASMVLVALAVLPRFGPSNKPPSRLFFGRIAHEYGHDPTAFVSQLGGMSAGDWIDELGTYLVDASRIATAKHRYVRRATVLTAGSVAAWCAVVLALFAVA